MKFLDARLSAGNRFVDIGADLEDFAMHTANLVGDQDKVVAFEPIPSVAARLDARLSHEIVVDVDYATVHAVDGPVHMVKIDVEGYEFGVLHWLSEVLEADSPGIVIAETIPVFLERAGRSVFNIMKRSSYRAFAPELKRSGRGHSLRVVERDGQPPHAVADLWRAKRGADDEAFYGKHSVAALEQVACPGLHLWRVGPEKTGGPRANVETLARQIVPVTGDMPSVGRFPLVSQGEKLP